MNRVLLSNISDNLGIKSHRKSAAYPDHFIKTGFLIGKAINRDFIVFFDLRGFPQFSSRLNNLCVFVRVLDAWKPPPWKSWQRRDALSQWWHHPPSISRRRGRSRNSKRNSLLHLFADGIRAFAQVPDFIHDGFNQLISHTGNRRSVPHPSTPPQPTDHWSWGRLLRLSARAGKSLIED